jgi:hypothetical protein
MWWIEYLKAGFTEPASLSSLILYRLIFAFCCILKFLVETKRGYFHYFNENTYLYGFYQIRRHIFHISPFIYQATYVIKIVAAFCLLLGFFPSISLLILLSSFVIETQIYFKFHTNFFLLITLCLLLSSDLENSLVLWDIWKFGISAFIHKVAEQKGDLFPQFLIMVTLTIMYLSTVYRKLNPVFLSGAVIYTHLQQKLEEANTRKYFDGIYPAFLTKFLVHQHEPILTTRWKPMMITTLLLETLIPIFLWFESTQVVGIVLGIFMHAAFTLIAPGTLAHFSLITIGTYILFVNPKIILDWLISL